MSGAALAQTPPAKPPYPPVVSALIASARTQVHLIDLESFKSALDKDEAGMIIDVREPNEYAAGHIPSAINLPRGVVELRIWPHLGYPAKTDLDRKLTIYCSTGQRNVLAAKSLQEIGFTNIVAVDMRIEDWGKAGYPLVKE